MNDHQQSVLLAIIPFALFTGCLLLSYLAKKPSRALWLFRLCALVEGCLVFSYIFCTDYVALLIITFFIGFFNGAPFALIEGYLVPIIKEKKGNYALVRLFGTLGYIVSLGLGFFALRYFPVSNTYYLSTALFLASLGVSFFLRERAPEESIQPIKEVRFTKILTPSCIFYLLFAALLYGAYNASGYQLPALLNQLGFADEHYSLARCMAVVTELVFLLLAPFVARLLKKKVALFLACFFIMFATTFPFWSSDSWTIAYGNLISGHVGKALLFAFEALWLSEIFGDSALSWILMAKTGAYNLISAVLNLSGNYLSRTWTYHGYYLFLLGLELIGFVFFVLVAMRSRKGLLKPETE